jgi:hypothetical protein
MFMLSMGAGTDICFPDVCNTPTPVGPIPIPYPNVAVTATSAPAAYNVLVDCMPALNQLSFGMVSVGDEAGMGIVDEINSGEAVYIVGCITILTEGVPAQRMTSVTGQNAVGVAPNGPGACLVPSQVTVLTLG